MRFDALFLLLHIQARNAIGDQGKRKTAKIIIADGTKEGKIGKERRFNRNDPLDSEPDLHTEHIQFSN